MTYDKHEQFGRYNPFSNNHTNSQKYIKQPNIETVDEAEDIPLPNEIEEGRTPDSERYNFDLLELLKNRIHSEELMLIALIILLFSEGVEDDILLILLIYILLT